MTLAIIKHCINKFNYGNDCADYGFKAHICKSIITHSFLLSV